MIHASPRPEGGEHQSTHCDVQPSHRESREDMLLVSPNLWTSSLLPNAIVERFAVESAPTRTIRSNCPVPRSQSAIRTTRLRCYTTAELLLTAKLRWSPLPRRCKCSRGAGPCGCSGRHRMRRTRWRRHRTYAYGPSYRAHGDHHASPSTRSPILVCTQS